MKRVELMPVHENRKSYYGKAIIEQTAGGHEALYSYGTLVAEFEPGLFVSGQYKVHGRYSSTTDRHVAEFLRQRGVRVSTIEYGRVVRLTNVDVTPDYTGMLV